MKVIFLLQHLFFFIKYGYQQNKKDEKDFVSRILSIEQNHASLSKKIVVDSMEFIYKRLMK